MHLLIFNKVNCGIKMFCLQRRVSANQVVKVAELNVLFLNINLESLILRQVHMREMVDSTTLESSPEL